MFAILEFTDIAWIAGIVWVMVVFAVAAKGLARPTDAHRLKRLGKNGVSSFFDDR